MTEDPREFGLTAADLRTAADRLYPPADPRLDRAAGTWDEAAQFGRIRSRLRDLADAIDPQEGNPMTHDPARPGIPDQLAALSAYRALLTTADLAAVHEAASSGACDLCTTVAAVTFAYTLAQELAGAGFVQGHLAARLLAVVQDTEDELRRSGN
jgi:hypothetical protein